MEADEVVVEEVAVVEEGEMVEDGGLGEEESGPGRLTALLVPQQLPALCRSVCSGSAGPGVRGQDHRVKIRGKQIQLW